MKHTDADILTTSERDQAEAGATDLARTVATFYREVTAQGVPRDLAAELTRMFMVATAPCGCDCDE